MEHEYFMQRCVNLAKNGLGHTSPNPIVGCVIVFEGKIIGEGFHTKAGNPHAEVEAIASVKDQSLLKKATIYVTLEPCSHFGKTPPCSNLIIEKEIPTVVVSSLDPNPEVSGRGIKRLKDHNIEVITGILKNECDNLNKRFFTFHLKKRPYIFLKWAQTQDGFVDENRDNGQGALKITSIEASRLVHKMRATEDAILIGKNTLLKDNPSLNTRLVGGNNPIPIILGWPEVDLENLNFLKYHDYGLVFSETAPPKHPKIKWIEGNPRNLTTLLKSLYKLEIQSVLVEGGTSILQSFIDANFWDEAHVFEGKQKIESGIKGPEFDFKNKGDACRMEKETLWVCTKS